MKWSSKVLFALIFAILLAIFTGDMATLAGPVGASVYVDYDIERDTVWSGRSNYYICMTPGNDEPKILNGATLTIESGATVYFAEGLGGNYENTSMRPYSHITIENGSLYATGVTFTTPPERETEGGGIIAYATSDKPTNLSFTNCIFEHTGYKSDGAAIRVNEGRDDKDGLVANVTVSECVFRNAHPESTGIAYAHGHRNAGAGTVRVEKTTFSGLGRGVQIDRNSQDDIDIFIDSCTFNSSNFHSVEIMDGRLASITNCIFNDNNDAHNSLMLGYSYNFTNFPKEVILSGNTFNAGESMSAYPIVVHANSQINKDEDYINTFDDKYPEHLRYINIRANIGPQNGVMYEKSVVWGNVGFPYVVNYGLAIDRIDESEYCDLTIKPGVTVYLDSSERICDIKVQGSLIAEGTEDSPITFACKPGATGAGQIMTGKFLGELLLRNCVIDGLYRGLWIEVASGNKNDDIVMVDNCVFRNTVDGGAVAAIFSNSTEKGKITIANSVFEGTDRVANGIIVEEDYYNEGPNSIKIKNCLIYGFRENGIVIKSFYSSDPEKYAPRIENCTIADNGDCGILFIRNDKGFETHAAYVKNSIIYGNGFLNIGNFCRDYFAPSSEPFLVDKSISYCLIGPDDVEFKDRIFIGEDPKTAFFEIPESALYNVITDDPLFADPDKNNYSLKSKKGRWNGEKWVKDRATSPAINTGDPKSPYKHEPSPNGSRINMGYLGNTQYASMGSRPSIFSRVGTWLVLIVLSGISILVLKAKKKFKNT